MTQRYLHWGLLSVLERKGTVLLELWWESFTWVSGSEKDQGWGPLLPVEALLPIQRELALVRSPTSGRTLLVGGLPSVLTDPHQLLHGRSCCLDLPILSDPQLWLLLLSPLTSASPLQVCWIWWTLGGFPGGSAGKESTCNAGDPGSISGLGKFAGEGICYRLQYPRASLVAQMVKNPPLMWETWVWPLGWEDALEKWIATHSSILAWRIPWIV